MAACAMTGRRCLVTGATDPKSIGYACAQALLAAGAAHVTVMGRDQAKVEAAVAGLKGDGHAGQVSGVVGDLKHPGTMAGVVTHAVQAMGGLDTVVVSGGNGGSEYLGLDTQDPASYRMMNDVAVLSPMFLVEAAYPELAKAAGGGTVVVVSSLAPKVPWPDTAPFNLAKAAQNTLVETLAFKYREGNVRVNGVLPACIHTGALDRMAAKKGKDVGEYAHSRAIAHPMAKNGTPQEVAHAVLFLASGASSFNTGTLLNVDGGLMLTNWFNQTRYLKEYVGGTKDTK